MADNVLRKASMTFLTHQAPCPVPAVKHRPPTRVALLRQETMNGTHLRSKLFELLSIILFWFYPYL